MIWCHLGFWSEVKFDLSTSLCWPVSMSTSNLVKIWWRAAKFRQFMCFQNGGRPPSWIFTEVIFEGISVSETSVSLWAKFCVIMCNSDSTVLWPLKLIFKMIADAILHLVWTEIWRMRKSRPLCMYLCTKLLRLCQRAAELWRFMCFQNGGWPPSRIFFGNRKFHNWIGHLRIPRPRTKHRVSILYTTVVMLV